ncbi:MAG: XamI family restriction endonuclease, partial [Chloroflexota bacterium]
NATLVRDLFNQTDDLLAFGSGTALAQNPSLLQAARYLSGPPVSADDLDTLADTRIASRRRLDADLSRRAGRIIEAALDRERLPWLFETPPRRPTAAERETAIRWTAGLQAAQQVQTARRSEAATRQETAVEKVLLGLDFRKVAPRHIDAAGGLARGEFSRESRVAGSKCDVPIGLRDGRFLFLECKVSNSGTNSVKRLNREVGGKAPAWREEFGARAITAAVLAGVFKLKNLQDAQAAGVVIFWEHDLISLADFLRAAA